MVSTTMGSDPSHVTAVMLLAGVEPLLTAAPNSARDIMSGWNLGADQFAGIIAENEAAFPGKAGIDEKFEDAAWEFRVDVDFLGIGAAVAPDNTCWNRGEGRAPPIEAASGGYTGKS